MERRDVGQDEDSSPAGFPRRAVTAPPRISGQARRLMPAALTNVPGIGADTTSMVEPSTWAIDAAIAVRPVAARIRSPRRERRQATGMATASTMAAAHQKANTGRR
jgi:hypothetical protein